MTLEFLHPYLALVCLALVVVWTLAAALTVKLDAVLVGRESSYRTSLALSLFVWPLIAALLLTTRHRVGSVTPRYDY